MEPLIRVRDYLTLIRASWVVLLLSSLAFGGLAVASVSAQQTMYQSTATVTLSTCVLIERTGDCDPIRGTPYAVQRAGIYASIAGSEPVLEQAFPDLEFSERSAIKNALSAVALSSSPVVEIRVQWPDGERAIELANQISTALVDYSATSIDDVRPDLVSVHIEPASEASPVATSGMTTIVLGFVLGLALAFAFVLARYFLDRRVRSVSEAESLSGTDVLARLPIIPTPSRRGKPTAAASCDDEFRRLRAGIVFRTKDAPSSTVLVTSSQAEESASEVATGLAIALAESGSRVLLVETDLRNPSIARNLQLNADHDLSKFLDSDSRESAPLQHVGPLQVIPAAPASTEEAIVLVYRQLPRFLEEQHDKFDFVIISAGPLGPNADTLSVLPAVGSVLLVARVGFVQRRDLRSALTTLEMLGRTPIGLTMTGTKQQLSV